MKMDLNDLGLDKEKLADMVIERMCERLLGKPAEQDDDPEYDYYHDTVEQRLLKRIEDRVTAEVDRHAERSVLPRVDELILGLKMTLTNKWGEPKGEPKTFTEYLAERAEQYLLQSVGYDGKPKDRGYGCDEYTRIAYLVDKHLAGEIRKAMNDTAKQVESIVAKGMVDTAKLKLDEIRKTISVKIDHK